MYKFRVPKLGQSDSEMEILEIMIEKDDQIKVGDPVVDIETEKASTILESEITGRVEEVFFKKGDFVKVGDIIFTMEEEK